MLKNFKEFFTCGALSESGFTLAGCRAGGSEHAG